MIARILGTILEKQPTRLVVDVAGVGYEVLVPLPTSQAAGDAGAEILLHTVLVVREDSHTLYGFGTRPERDLFRKLIGVSGIGPKIALGALSGSSPAGLVTALREQDLVTLTRLPGVGKKTAERMVLELKDGLAGFTGAAPAEAAVQSHADAVGALVSLGYSRPAASDAVKKAVVAAGPEADVETLVRTALGRLSGGRGTG
jgi:Holliday junction DNA helicase RuvA